jgi:hypothetical protein
MTSLRSTRLGQSRPHAEGKRLTPMAEVIEREGAPVRALEVPEQPPVGLGIPSTGTGADLANAYSTRGRGDRGEPGSIQFHRPIRHQERLDLLASVCVEQAERRLHPRPSEHVGRGLERFARSRSIRGAMFQSVLHRQMGRGVSIVRDLSEHRRSRHQQNEDSSRFLEHSAATR